MRSLTVCIAQQARWRLLCRRASRAQRFSAAGFAGGVAEDDVPVLVSRGWASARRCNVVAAGASGAMPGDRCHAGALAEVPILTVCHALFATPPSVGRDDGVGNATLATSTALFGEAAPKKSLAAAPTVGELASGSKLSSPLVHPELLVPPELLVGRELLAASDAMSKTSGGMLKRRSLHGLSRATRGDAAESGRPAATAAWQASM
mmetsp:Transcript_49924/g.139779  ORF Transcript_49924/g.139779 Transcript_49924/m.139779 type:complete len:206 (+) Transcript_49924:1028-1645(+)